MTKRIIPAFVPQIGGMVESIRTIVRERAERRARRWHRRLLRSLHVKVAPDLGKTSRPWDWNTVRKQQERDRAS